MCKIKSFLIFIFCLFFFHTKAQTNNASLNQALQEVSFDEYPIVEIDSILQERYKDTIQIVKKTLKGAWHFQGTKTRLSSDLIDTIFKREEIGVGIVKNGVVYIVNNNNLKETKGRIVSSFDFSNSKELFSEVEMNKLIGNQNEFGDMVFEVKSCPPIYNIVYFQMQIGILSQGMGGQYFSPIKFLSDKVLIIKNDDELDCYLKME
jgi:hypothetical protein